MDEGVNPRPRLRHDVAAQRREIVDAGIACRHDRGRALELHQFVGGNADRRAIGIDVGNAGRSSPGVTSLPEASMVLEARAAGISASIASITPQRMPMSRFPRSDWLGSSTIAALDDEVELVVRPHRGIAAPGHARRRRPIRSKLKKITA